MTTRLLSHALPAADDRPRVHFIGTMTEPSFMPGSSRHGMSARGAGPLTMHSEAGSADERFWDSHVSGSTHGVSSPALLRRVGEFLPYVAIPVLGGLAPIMVIPAITSTQGASVWATVAVAQSIGAGAAVVVELGWGVTGPQLVAAASPEERRSIFAASVYSKVPVVGLGALVSGALAFLLAGQGGLVPALVAAGAALVALQQSWYFVGTGRPRDALLTDTSVRVLTSAASAAALLAGAPLLVFALLMVAQPIASLALASLRARPRWEQPRRALSIGLASTRTQGVVTLGRSIGGVYTALPIAIVSVAAPSAVADFAALERLMRMGLTVLNSVPQSLQSWIGGSTGGERIRRTRAAVLWNAALGVVAGTAFALLGGPVSRLVFTGEITVSRESTLAFALVVALVCTSRGTGLALVGLGRANSITVAIAVSAAVGAPAIYLLAQAFGAAGGAAGEITAEAVCLVVQLLLFRRFSRDAVEGTAAPPRRRPLGRPSSA